MARGKPLRGPFARQRRFREHGFVIAPASDVFTVSLTGIAAPEPARRSFGEHPHRSFLGSRTGGRHRDTSTTTGADVRAPQAGRNRSTHVRVAAAGDEPHRSPTSLPSHSGPPRGRDSDPAGHDHHPLPQLGLGCDGRRRAQQHRGRRDRGGKYRSGLAGPAHTTANGRHDTTPRVRPRVAGTSSPMPSTPPESRRARLTRRGRERTRGGTEVEAAAGA